MSTRKPGPRADKAENVTKAARAAKTANAAKATKDDRLSVGGSIWLTVGGESFGGKARIELLRAIAEKGSITHAAKAVGISYKSAWDAIDTMNTLAGEPLVARSTGGKGGGSTQLTARGRRLVDG